MKKIKPIYVLIGGSVLWLLIFALIFSQYLAVTKSLNDFDRGRRQLDNLNFLRRNVQNLERETIYSDNQSLRIKSIPEFITRLPEIAKTAGVRRIDIENVGMNRENSGDAAVIKVAATASYSNLAGFVDMLERVSFPLQISSLQIYPKGGVLNSEIIININKKKKEETSK